MSDFNFANNADNLGSNPDYNYASDLLWQITNWGIIGGTNITLSTSGDAVTIANDILPYGLTEGVGITFSTSGNNITITATGDAAAAFGLIAGDNISIGTSGTDYTFNYTGPTSGGGGSPLGLQASTGISLGTVGDVVTITNTTPDTTFGISAGTDISLGTVGDVITINSTASGGGSPLGLIGGTNITLGTSGDVVTVDADTALLDLNAPGQIATLANTTPSTGDLFIFEDATDSNKKKYCIGSTLGLTHPHAASNITSGTFLDARIAESNVTQHEAALTITESQISDLSKWGVLGGSNITLSTAGDVVTINSSASGGALGLDAGTGISLGTAGDVVTVTNSITDLASLTDVDASVSSPSDGDILVYRSAGSDWVLEAKPAGGSSPAMADITDVTITTVADNEVLAYDTTSGEWINQTAAEAGLAAASHTHATSDITSGTFDDARIAESNVTQHQAALTITESQISDLSHTQLGLQGGTDISLGTVGDVVTINSTASAPSVGDLSDTTITSVADNEVLAYNSGSGEWINQTAAEAGLAAASHTHAASDITSGTFLDARIAESNVTQHQAALTITESQISDLSHTQLGLDSGTGISLGTVGDVVTITNTAPDTTFGISAGTDISLGTSGDVITINSTASGGGGSSSEINYVSNPDFETNTTGWAAYADAAATTPADGTGGSPTSTFTRTTSTPLRGTGSGLFSKPASNEQGEGFSYDFTIDEADKGQLLSITADIDFSGTPGDMTVYVYDVTNTNLITVGDPIIDPSSARLITSVLTDSSSTSYRLIFHVASTSTTAYTLKIDNVKITPLERVATPTKILLDTQTASSSSSIDFTNHINSTYDKYIIELQNVIPATDDVALDIRTSSNGGSSWDSGGSHYTTAGFAIYSTGSASVGSAGSAQARMTPAGGTLGISNNTSEGGLSGTLTLYNPADSSVSTRFSLEALYTLAANPGNNYLSTECDSSGARKAAAAVNGIQFLMSSGNIASGTFKLYGIKDTSGDSNFKPLGEHEVFVTGGNGNGSTNTVIRRFDTPVRNTGTAISYSDSATDGASFTINEEGVYAITYMDRSPGNSSWMGISKNSSQLTTTIRSITNADRLINTSSFTSYQFPSVCSTTVYLKAGDVIRPHHSGSFSSTADEDVSFRIVKVASPITASGTLIGGTVGQHEVFVTGGNGMGSTNTVIRRFDATIRNTGTAISYSDSAADGALFTINEDGIYTINYCDLGITLLGVSKNSTELTTSIASITNEDRLINEFAPGSTVPSTCSVTTRLVQGDEIRPHCSGSASATTNEDVSFRIIKVGN